MLYYKEPHSQGPSTKFLSRWTGPYRVVGQIVSVTYRIRHLTSAKETIAHVNRLRKVSPYVSATPDLALAAPHAEEAVTPAADLSTDPGVIAQVQIPTPMAVTDDDEPAYNMEAVVGKRRVGDTLEYLVKFVGYDEPEWCYDYDILGAGRDLVKKYEASVNPAQAGKPSTKATRPKGVRRSKPATASSTADTVNLRRSAQQHAPVVYALLRGVWTRPGKRGGEELRLSGGF